MRRPPLTASAAWLVMLGANLVVACFPDPGDLKKQTLGGLPDAAGTVPGGDGGTGADGPGGTVADVGVAPGYDAVAGGGVDTAAPVETRDQACASLARALAATAWRCSRFLIEFQYGSQAAHEQRILLNCRNLDAPGTRWPVRPFAPCGQAVAAMSCDDWYEGNSPAVCLAPGPFAEGLACTVGDQCQTGFCDRSGAGACGRCVRLPVAGQPCLQQEYCAPGLVCNAAGTCVPPGNAGAGCSQIQPCRSSLSCLGGICQRPLSPGAACTTNDDCNFLGGVICNDDLGKCVNVTVGNGCRLNPDGSYVFCGGSARCEAGTCVPPSAEGGPCGEDQGPRCVWPAFCGNGTCQLARVNATCAGMAASENGPGRFLRAPEHRLERLDGIPRTRSLP